MTSFLKKLAAFIVLLALTTEVSFADSRTTTLIKPIAAPAVSFTTIDGNHVTLENWKGKLRLVNFWATWCAPCRKEMPTLIDAQKRYGSVGLQIIGPALDDAKSVRELAARLKINYPVMANDSESESAMFLLGNAEVSLPFSVLIDAQGRIVQTVLGDMTSKELDTLISANLPAVK